MHHQLKKLPAMHELQNRDVPLQITDIPENLLKLFRCHATKQQCTISQRILLRSLSPVFPRRANDHGEFVQLQSRLCVQAIVSSSCDAPLIGNVLNCYPQCSIAFEVSAHHTPNFFFDSWNQVC